MRIDLHVFGEFGRAVGERLTAAGGASRVSEIPGPRSAFAPGDEPLALVATVSARPLREYWAQIDRHQRASGGKWLAVEMTDMALRHGPIFGTPGVACFDCVARRRESLLSQTEREQELDIRSYFDKHDVELRGFAPYAVTVAAQAIRMAQAGETDPGLSHEIALLTLDRRQGKPSALHGCPRCFSHKIPPADRFSARLTTLSEICAREQRR